MANKISANDIEKIQNLSYTELGKAVVSGDYSIKQLRQAYTQMRDIAQKRIMRLNKPENIKQFGQPEEEVFRTLKNLPTTSELLKEIKDVSRFLKTKQSTIKGQRERRKYTINLFKKEGFNVSNKDYPNLQKFLKWFKTSEFSQKFDSDSPQVAEVFNSEKPNEKDWERAFNAFRQVEEKSAPVRNYKNV